jgi:hypothetical protein
MTLGLGGLFLIAALVLYILTAILGFGLVGHVTIPTLIGLAAVGLGCQLLAGVPWPAVARPQ